LSTSSPPSFTRINRRIDGGMFILLALAVAVLAAAFWAVSLRGDLESARDENTVLQQEIDLLRSQANATAYELAPSADAPQNALGTAFFSLNGSGVISVANLAPLQEGRRYQVWFYPTSEAEPIPGATFAVDEHGSAFMLIPADVGVFTNLSITVEPEAGTTSPTGPVILSGSTGGARG
jgi:anti-sigma-K factor RskA